VGLESVISTPVAPPPPKAASPAPSSNSSSTGSSSGAASSQASAGSQSGSSSAANSNSASSASRAAARNSANAGKSSNSASNTANTQGKNSAASSQANQSGSSAQTQSAAAASAKNGATQPGTTSGPSFIEALAQSQASAADSATAATTATANATADGIVGSGGKGKAAKGGDTDPTAASFGFLSQSLVAAMAGGQQPNTTQVTTNGDSSDGVSLASGSNIESIVANLTDGAADALQGADGDGKAAGSATGASASAADGSASGTGAFQAQMGVTSHFQANATANTQTTNDKVSSPVGTTAFNDEVGGKVTWMASQRVQSASLQISPEHMGPVEVRISMQDGATSVAFSANHADTRAALEQALPRLREMFATQGLTLSDASVSQQSPRGQSQKQAVAAIGAIGGTSTDGDSTSSVAALNSARLGLVDTYA
jgi:flagellar hook-length control protein FliK